MDVVSNSEPDGPGKEIEKRKPKPFRYVSDLKEINNNSIEEIPNSVMLDEVSTAQKIQENFESVIGVGDIETIESVLKKHEEKRENKNTIGIV